MEENLRKWIDKVIKKRPEIGGMAICPFAKKGVEEKKVYFYSMTGDPKDFILKCVDNVMHFELIAFYDETKTLTDDGLKCIIEDLQKIRHHMIFLKDHPDSPGYIKGLYTGNGEYPVILVQPRDKLESAREKLKKTNYYDFWSEEYKKEIWSYGSESESV